MADGAATTSRSQEPLYREAGVRNGRTVKPIELCLGIIEHMTPDMARIVIVIWRRLRGIAKTLGGRGTEARNAVAAALSYIRRRRNPRCGTRLTTPRTCRLEVA
jgi:hypothetical protein